MGRGHNPVLKESSKEEEAKRTTSCYKCGEHYFPNHHSKPTKTTMVVEELAIQDVEEGPRLEELTLDNEDTTCTISI